MVRARRNVSVLLLADDEHLGQVGDVVHVRPGFARNFLFPKGAACPVTPDALQRVEREKKRAAKLRAERARRVEELAAVLEGLSVTLEERAGEEGHLFGSVGATRIAKSLAEQGVTVEERQILLEAPLKELGVFRVPVRLDADRTADIRVWIVD